MADAVLDKHKIGEGDKAKEYFKLKKQVSLLRADKKDLEAQHELYEESQKLAKQLKKLRDEIKDDEKIKEFSEKIKEIRERMDLLKEMIRIELIENSQEEVKEDGKVLKLIYVVKEAKDVD